MAISSQILIVGSTSTIGSNQLKFEELQMMNFMKGILAIKEPAVATLASSQNSTSLRGGTLAPVLGAPVVHPPVLYGL